MYELVKEQIKDSLLNLSKNDGTKYNPLHTVSKFYSIEIKKEKESSKKVIKNKCFKNWQLDSQDLGGNVCNHQEESISLGLSY